MARRSRDPDVPAAVDRDELRWRSRWLVAVLFPACDPASPAAEARWQAVCDDAARIRARGLPVEREVAEIESMLAGHGLLDRATRGVESLRRARGRREAA